MNKLILNKYFLILVAMFVVPFTLILWKGYSVNITPPLVTRPDVSATPRPLNVSLASNTTNWQKRGEYQVAVTLITTASSDIVFSDLALTFDPNFLALREVKNDYLFTTTTDLVSDIDNQKGNVRVVFGRSPNSQNTKSLVVATFLFETKTSGRTSISLSPTSSVSIASYNDPINLVSTPLSVFVQ